MKLAESIPLQRRLKQFEILPPLPERESSERPENVAALAWLARDQISLCMTIPADFQSLWDEIVHFAAKKEIEDYQQAGELLDLLFRKYFRFINSIQELVQLLSRHGCKVEKSQQLVEVEGDLRTLQKATLGTWPWTPTADDLRMAREEDRSGETASLDEALARIAGVRKKDWLEKVERCKQAR